MRCMGLTKIILNARDLLPKLRILNICQFGNEVSYYKMLHQRRDLVFCQKVKFNVSLDNNEGI